MLPSPSHADTSRALPLVLAAAGFASTFAGRIADPLVGVIAADLATAVATVALLASAFALPYAFIQPVLGPVGDSLGKIRIIRACLAVLAAALLGSALAPETESLFALRILSGMAAGGVIPLALAAIGDRVAIEARQVAISRFLVAIILGQLAGSSLSGILAETLGWRGVFLLAAAIAAVAFLACTFGVGRSGAKARPFSATVALSRYRGLLANPRARALFTLVFAEAIAIFGVFPFVAPILEESGAGGPAEAGLALAGFAIGGLVYSASVRWMLARLGLRRMLIGGGFVGASALCVVGYAHDWRVFAGAFVLLGLGFYMLHNSFQTQVTELSSEARASAVALHAFSFFCGGALGPVLFGLGLGALGQEVTLVAAATAIALLGVAAARALCGPLR